MDQEKKVILYFAGAILSVVFVMVALIIFVPIPETGQEHAKYALAFLLGVASTIISYFWGSSKGSADKSQTISDTTQVIVDNAKAKAVEEKNENIIRACNEASGQ